MDPPSIVKSFKYSSTTQQPMFTTVVELQPPLHYTSSPSPSLSPTPPSNSISFQDVSFSSYLKPKDLSQKPQENGGVDDTEISIFGAHKYFSDNSVTDPVKKHDIMSVPRLSTSVSSTDGYGRNFRTRSLRATPTASSEASWNSQTGLLANPPGSVGISLPKFDDSKKRSSAARKWMFGRKCCCTGKKSVEVKEATTSDSDHGGPVMIGATEINKNVKPNFLYAKRDSFKSKNSPTTISHRSSFTNIDILEVHQAKDVAPNSFPSPDPPRQQRISASGRPFVDGIGNFNFSFPILSSSNEALKGIITITPDLEDPPRDSLEVFQPAMHEAAPTGGQRYNPGTPFARVLNTDDDVGSDASSDLFEIESFSTQTTSYPMYRRRDSLDEAPTFNARRFASTSGLNLNTNGGGIQFGRRSLDEPPTPSVAATECYAPSEVSIDWSVTTAEGFDKASVSNFSLSASEMGSVAFLRQRLQEEPVGGGEIGKTKKGNGTGLLLMSCRQEKAVSVGPEPVKCMAAAEVGGRATLVNKPPLGCNHSARLSLAFAT